MAARFFMMAEAAERLQIHPQTLRGWERAGKIPPATRRNGIRLFTEDDLTKIAEIVYQTPATANRESQ